MSLMERKLKSYVNNSNRAHGEILLTNYICLKAHIFSEI